MWRYLALRKFGAVFTEMLLIVWCVLVGYFVQLHTIPTTSSERYQLLGKAFLIAVLFQIALHLNDIYRFRGSRLSREFVLRIFQALLAASGVLAILFFTIQGLSMDRGAFACSLILSSAFISKGLELKNFEMSPFS